MVNKELSGYAQEMVRLGGAALFLSLSLSLLAPFSPSKEIENSVGGANSIRRV